MHDYDLVVLDLDGTVMNPYRREAVSAAVLEAIAAAEALGVKVTVGTGRTLDYIRHQMPTALHLPHPVIATQGAVIGDPRTGQVLVEQDLPAVDAYRLAHWVDDNNYLAAFYVLDDDGRTHVYRNQSGRDRAEEELLEHLLGHPAEHAPHFVALLDRWAPHPPIKVIVWNHPDYGVDVAAALEERFGAHLSITRTHEWLVEATAAGVDKGSGLRKLCDLLGVEIGRVIAVGDSDNDIPMLRAAGLGVAMGNANARVKAVADWIAPSLDEDGVAATIHQWLLAPHGKRVQARDA